MSDNCLSSCLLIFYQTATPHMRGQQGGRQADDLIRCRPLEVLAQSRPYEQFSCVCVRTCICVRVCVNYFAYSCREPAARGHLYCCCCLFCHCSAILRIRNTFCGFLTAKLLKQAGKSNCYETYQNCQDDHCQLSKQQQQRQDMKQDIVELL